MEVILDLKLDEDDSEWAGGRILLKSFPLKARAVLTVADQEDAAVVYLSKTDLLKLAEAFARAASSIQEN